MRLLNVAAEFTNWNPVIDKIRTFVDSGVLITAARGSGESAHDALAILDDPDRDIRSNLIESPEDASIKKLLIQSNQCRLRVRFKSLNSRQGRNHARRATHLVG